MTLKIELKGRKFGKLRVSSEAGRTKSGSVKWRCLCECGNSVEIAQDRLRSGKVESCGCVQPPSRVKDITGQTFGRLTAIFVAGRAKNRSAVWLCECLCGNKVKVLAHSLKSGHTQSCGCLSTERKTSHGMYSNPLYRIWSGILSRCYSRKSLNYGYYGEQGITVCHEWRETPKTFITWAINNGYKKGLYIDRIQNSKGYCPSNCRWVTSTMSVINRRLITKANTSGYCGAYKTLGRRFQSVVYYFNKSYYQGTFNTAKQAAIARDKFIIKNDWPHKLNFPHLKENV